MIRKIAIAGIVFYQKLLSPIIVQIVGSSGGCRYSPTCSEYTKQMIGKHGIFGILLGVKRIGACR